MKKITWHEVTIEDKNLFERYLKAANKQGHEYTFANFYTWRKNKSKWSIIDRAPEKLEHSLEHSDTVLSAWKGKQLIGIANAISDGELVVYFPHLIVHPDHQRTGIGKSLMEIMLKKYAHCDQKIIISHKEATKFYEKLGFMDTRPHAGMWIHNSSDL